MDHEVPKHIRYHVSAAGTYAETTSHTSTMKKLHLNPRITMKPQEEWAEFQFIEDPFVSEKPHIRTKECVRALEVYQKQKIIQHEIVHEHLRKLENKEFNKAMGRWVDGMSTMCNEPQKCMHRIAALEETNRKLRARVVNAMTPP
jgi:hypothetical protein